MRIKIMTILALMLPMMSWADCKFDLDVSAIYVTWTGSTQDLSRIITLSKEKDVQKLCEKFFYSFTTGGCGSYQRKLTNSTGETLDYNLYKYPMQNVLLVGANDINSVGDYIYGDIPDDDVPVQSTFYFNLPALANSAPLVRSGFYTDNFIVQAYSGTLNGKNRQEESRSVFIGVTIPKMIDLSLVDSGSSFDVNDTQQTLDFGQLETGEIQSFDLKVRGNAGVSISFSSQNLGKLAITDKTETISYTIKVDGAVKNLSSGSVEVVRTHGVTGQSGNTHPVSVQIGDVSGKSAGTYSDYIVITAMTIE